MESYEQVLKEAYGKIKRVSGGSERFEIPNVEGQVAGKSTIIVNIMAIASYMRRPVDQILRFLQKELATAAKIDNGRLVLGTRLNSAKVNEKIRIFAKHFVICNECGKPDTELIVDKGIKFKHCLACGAKSPIKYAL